MGSAPDLAVASGLSALAAHLSVRQCVCMWDFDVTSLGRSECLELLSQVSVGRIGASIDALPVIFPVHFALFGESVLFRTVPGTKLDAATIGAVVAFQADAQEPLDGNPWTVLLQGIASAVTDEWDQSQARSVRIKSWLGIDDHHHHHHLVRLEATNITGRRFGIAGEGPSVELPDAPTL
jgi:nitroimidazol reductase NimA-like FMN-containing flavoprotein (pyridoxamine 5'-phosphate oxidase superfamily)